MKPSIDKSTKITQLIQQLLNKYQIGKGLDLDFYSRLAITELIALYNEHNLDLARTNLVLSIMAASGECTQDEFFNHARKYYEEDIQSAIQNITLRKIIIPFHAEIGADINLPLIFTINDTKMSVVKLDGYLRTLNERQIENIKKVKYEMTSYENRSLPDNVVIIESESHSTETAWEKVSLQYFAMRGVIELTLSENKWSYHSNPLERRRNIAHPQWLLFLDANDKVDYLRYYTDDEPSGILLKIDNALYTKIIQNSEIIKDKFTENSVFELIANCLTYYALAMDSKGRPDIFLSLWQMAESLTNAATKGGNTSEVVKRLSWHCADAGLPGAGLSATLRKYAEKRNALVHSANGRFNDDDEINTLKMCCEIALRWLYSASSEINTIAHLEKYYELCSLNSTQLQAISTAKDYIEKERKTKTKWFE